MSQRYLGQILAFLFFALLNSQAFADDAPKSELDLAYIEVDKAQISGPTQVTLGKQATLKLPAGFVFVPSKEAQQLLKAMGNGSEPDLLGIIVPEGEGSWFAAVRFIDSGYIKDDEAQSWDADELLQGLKEGTEEQNQERKKRGLSEIEVVRWVEKPLYNPQSHQLKWSALVNDKGNTNDSEASTNYNTYILSREGYLSLNFVADATQIEKEKPVAQRLLDAVTFNEGKAYGDFNEGTDKIATYGLAALVAGAAAKKLGLFAVILAFLAKFAKIIIVGVIAALAVIRKFFSRRPKNESL